MKTYFLSFMILFVSGGSIPASLWAQDLSSVVKLAKQAKAKELLDSMKPPSDPGLTNGSPAVATKKEVPIKPPPPPPPLPPVLKAIYGVNGDLQADLVYEGSMVVLTNNDSPDSLGVGGWKNGYVFSDGVLLSTTVISRATLEDISFKAQGQLGRKPVCKFLNYSDKQCLFLTPSLARADSVAGGFDEQVRALVRPTATPPMDYRATAGASFGGAVPMPVTPSAPAAGGGIQRFAPSPQAPLPVGGDGAASSTPAANNSPNSPKPGAFPR